MNIASLKMAWRNLARNKRRNFATASAVAIGVTGLTTLSSYIYQEENVRRVFTVYTSHVGHLDVYQEGGLQKLDTDPDKFSLTPAAVSKIRQILADTPGIDFHGPQLIGTGLISNGCNSVPFQALGVDPSTELRLRSDPEVQRWSTLANTDFSGQRLGDMPTGFAGVVLGGNLTKLLRKHRVYSEVAKGKDLALIDCKAEGAAAVWDQDANIQLTANGWSGSLGAADADIIGHLNTGSAQTDSNFVLAPLPVLQNLYGTDHVSRYTIWLTDPSRLTQVKEQLATRFAQAGLQVDIHSFDEEEVAPYYAGTLHFIRIIIFFIMAVMALVIGLSVFNAVTITAMERSKEIGMMRSIGYTRSQIRLVFALESGVLTALSMAVGFSGGALLNMALNAARIGYSSPGMDMAVEILSLSSHPIYTVLVGLVVFALATGTTLVAVWSIANIQVAKLLLGQSH